MPADQSYLTTQPKFRVGDEVLAHDWPNIFVIEEVLDWETVWAYDLGLGRSGIRILKVESALRLRNPLDTLAEI